MDGDARGYEKADWLAFVVTTAAALIVYLFTLTPDVSLGFSGIFSTAAMYGGVPHSPGYPLAVWWQGLFVHLLPLSNIAWRVAVSSAVAGALACGLIGLLVSRFGKDLIGGVDSNRVRIVCGVVAGSVFGFNGAFWGSAVIADVWTLSICLFCGALCLLMRWCWAPASTALPLFIRLRLWVDAHEQPDSARGHARYPGAGAGREGAPRSRPLETDPGLQCGVCGGIDPVFVRTHCLHGKSAHELGLCAHARRLRSCDQPRSIRARSAHIASRDLRKAGQNVCPSNGQRVRLAFRHRGCDSLVIPSPHTGTRAGLPPDLDGALSVPHAVADSSVEPHRLPGGQTHHQGILPASYVVLAVWFGLGLIKLADWAESLKVARLSDSSAPENRFDPA